MKTFQTQGTSCPDQLARALEMEKTMDKFYEKTLVTWVAYKLSA